MAVQQGRASFTQQMQGTLAGFHEQMKTDESTLGGGGEAPAGIDNGVARLTECKVDIYKSGEFKGKWYFLASGVVVLPKEHDGLPCEGLRTQIGPEPLCDTPKRTGEKARKTAKDHYEWLLKALRTLGVNTKGLSFVQVEAAIAAVKKQKPYFMFRTWKGKPTKEFPNPRVNHSWESALPNFDPSKVSSDQADGVVDQSDGVSDEVAQEAAQAPTPARKPAAPAPAKGGKPAAKPAPVVDDISGVATDDLVTRANEGDGDAQAELERRAMDLGWSQEAFAAATSWEESGHMATEMPPSEEGGDGGEPAEGEEGGEAAWMPEIDTVYKYTPLVKGPGGKVVKGKKEVECLVTAINEADRTCTLKNTVDGKTKYIDVPVDDLSGFEE